MASSEPTEQRVGLVQGFSAYLLWGFLPLFFALVDAAGPVEVVAHRVVWSLVFCAILLALVRGYRDFAALLRSPRILGILTVSSVLVLINWLLFVYAVNTGRTLEVSLGYFINPLITVLLSVIFLKEKLRPLQWIAMGLGVVAVAVIAIAYGEVPWISLTIALSFAGYGLVKNKVGGKVGALGGLSVETLILTIPALVYLGYITAIGQNSFAEFGAGHSVLLILLGPVTALPLLLFSAAARRIPLSWVGMLQYVAPIMQFIIGWAIFREEMSPARWAGFGLIWGAVVVLTIDMIRRTRK